MEFNGESRMHNGHRVEAGAGPYYPLGEFDVDGAGDFFPNDSSRLKQLGYKQELARGLSFVANFSVTFSIISVMTGITTMYNQCLMFGGPMIMVCGWPIVGAMTLIVGLSMAEICSAYPTAAGLYFWSAKLCGNEWGPFAAWLTGWYVELFFSLYLFFIKRLFFSIIGRTITNICCSFVLVSFVVLFFMCKVIDIL